MFRTIVLALFIIVALYVSYLLLKAYKPAWFRVKETFAPKPSLINMPVESIPSPAPPAQQPPPVEPERTVAPGGPAAPNASSDEMPTTMPPEVMPADPFQDLNMEAPIKDSMRHPEMSFGPGLDNSGVKKAAASGVMNKTALSSETPFSPEFAQNGGQFMGTITANDLNHDSEYATA